MSTKELLVCFGPNEKDNQAAVMTVSQLSNVNIRTIDDTVILNDHVLLPFIQNENGNRFYGLDSINRFVEKTKLDQT